MNMTLVLIAGLMQMSVEPAEGGDPRCGRAHSGVCIEVGRKTVSKRVIAGYRQVRVPAGYRWETRFRTEMRSKSVWKTRTVTRFRRVARCQYVTQYRTVTRWRTGTAYRWVTRYRNVRVPVRDYCGRIIGWRFMRSSYRCRVAYQTRQCYTVRIPIRVARTVYVNVPYRVIERYRVICQVPMRVSSRVKVQTYCMKRVPIFKCIQVSEPIFACIKIH